MDSGECAVAPSTPKPPARLTAATTSRQWLNASSGNSIPSMSQIGDFMAVSVPCDDFWRRLLLVVFCRVGGTLAHQTVGAKRPFDLILRSGFLAASRRMQARLGPHGSRRA